MGQKKLLVQENFGSEIFFESKKNFGENKVEQNGPDKIIWNIYRLKAAHLANL